MLFNSYEFLCGFLPLALLLFWLVSKIGSTWTVVLLGVCSIVFYSYWSLASVPILAVSVIANFWLGRFLSNAAAGQRARKAGLVAGVSFNLSLIAYFKYVGFLVTNLNKVLGGFGFGLMEVPAPTLPIGISFYTFTQIAFLVDAYRGRVIQTTFSRYFLFVTYFPHLVAGPILHFGRLVPQLKRFAPSYEQVSVGLFALAFGLAKKVLVADTFASIADAGFGELHLGNGLGCAGAWIACLAYTFQIYFDFSGYSDMAVGISLFFGICLPVNFHSPYKATSIIEFWRCWHISLSDFLREYLYIPLGGNRLGKARRYLNLLTTMVLGGLWHGASWTYVCWGLTHGVLLSLNHLMRDRLVFLSAGGRFFKAASWLLTFLSVSLAWVLFRSGSLTEAAGAYRSMFDLGSVLVQPIGDRSFLVEMWRGPGVPGWSLGEALPLLGLGLALCLLLPPVVEARDRGSSIGSRYLDLVSTSPVWGWVMGLGTALALFASILVMAKLSPFLYFQF